MSAYLNKENMKVLYDYQGFMQKIGGVSKVHLEIIKNLSSSTQYMLPILLSDNIYLDEIRHQKLSFLFNSHSNMRKNIFKLLNKWRSVIELEKGNYDIFHVTGLNPYFVSHVKKPVISTMHDMTHERYSDLIPKAEIVPERRKKILDASNHVICVSNQTKYDLIDIYKYPEEKISVIYPGSDGKMITNEDIPLFPRLYVLYIGGRGGYKNFSTFARAFALLNHDIDLVCTGSPFNREEMDLFKELDITDRTYQMFVTDREMDNLLCNASLFVYPSLAEGFGLPLLDSFRGSCPCVASDIQCFHEVADDAVLYFNPRDIEDIADKMELVLENADLRDVMINKGKERVPLFTWQKCAQETEAVYHLI